MEVSTLLELTFKQFIVDFSFLAIKGKFTLAQKKKFILNIIVKI